MVSVGDRTPLQWALLRVRDDPAYRAAVVAGHPDVHRAAGLSEAEWAQVHAVATILQDERSDTTPSDLPN